MDGGAAQAEDEEVEAGIVDDAEEDDDEIKEDSKEVIKLVNVHKTYLLGLEGVPALRGVNLTINDGEFITILGTSGGGKTTMLNIIGTIDKPSKGDVYICGLRIKYSTKDQLLASIRLNKLGFVFQTFNLIGSLTALENVELPMQLRGKLSKDEIRRRATQLLTEVGLGDRLDHFPNMLSGGEQQRVTIARSISNNPSILLLDEPTGDLDTKSTDIIMKILVDLNTKHGITMVMVTHDQGLKYFANRVVKMSDGKILKIQDIDMTTRNRYIAELEETVAAHHSGALNQGQVAIREGIYEASVKRDMERDGPPKIPANFTPLSGVATTKTSVRKPKDYPILSERFQPKETNN
jgi:putative ABC transport system ATP-binding protein